jgi:hypothetical protein
MTDDSTETRRARLAQQALSANVGGDNGIQHAKWWKVLLAVAILVAIPVTIYYFTAARAYSGQVVLAPKADQLQVRLGTSGTVLDLDPRSAHVTVRGGEVRPPGPLPDFLRTSPAEVHWIPYLFSRNGAGGWVVAIDLRP